ncbi:SGNH/GDSL hydrolase family protein [Paenibacillus sp. J5C_2022]|uniref:SGNH/GDSL hydrolase family protein n=1 Tax=Paenibacillus sp. J5C2022 TaxID=2977129 RepID=UPI0021D2CED7|nr:SGNH/GDSL hydrolase family protein [Paenibacillus sp. J5C2022]MCU6708727.1 SGNH/GDSL hydrolase family protein [Paenibacillus sp. J5C2022]
MKHLFVIGDSISIQYGPYLKKFVDDRYHYDRKRGEAQALVDLDTPVGANGGDSRMVLDYLLGEQQRSVKYDILLLNCGLHDIKTSPVTREKQVPPDKYSENLKQIIHVAQTMTDSFVWIRTTDVITEIHNAISKPFKRYHEDVLAYNAIADELMREYNIPMIDLYSFTSKFGPQAYCDHVHFTEEVRHLQAAFIAGFLESMVQT